MASAVNNTTNNTTIPSPASFRFENNESTQSLLSRHGSDFGSRFSLSDDSGVYISSLAVTIIISAIATIGIILVAVIITLAVMLTACEHQSHGLLLVKPRVPDFCTSFQLNAEVNNIQGWTVPQVCESHVSSYIQGGQYHRDFAEAVNLAGNYLKTQFVENQGQDAIVLAIDETALTNIPYYQMHHYGTEKHHEDMWCEWVEEAKSPPLFPMLALYRELQAANWSIIFITGRPEHHRNATTQNLFTAGYEGWASLILRSAEEVGLASQLYKSARRLQLEKKGYKIRSVVGDQWSDLIGPALGSRTFKLPNPMYYI